MIIQAGTFMIPYKLWSYWEGGLLEEFGYDARSTIMLRGEGLIFKKNFFENFKIKINFKI